MKTFLHSGNLGDIIYSLPFVRDMGGGILYIKPALYNESYDQFEASKSLLLLQPYIKDVRPYPIVPLFQYPIEVDYDLDLCRHQKRRGGVHLIKQYYLAFGEKFGVREWNLPWLQYPNPMDQARMKVYTVINVTPRWREGSFVKWEKIVPTIPGHKVFIGFDDEYNEFVRRCGPIERVICRNLLDMAIMVYYAERIYCNQSVLLTLAQGYGKKYFLERKAGRKNCLLYTPNERLLK